MAKRAQQDVTALLVRAGAGDRSAADALMPLVYDELRSLARRSLRLERPGGRTLEATALVHEAYLRLVRSDAMDWKNRAHFFASAATAIRRVLVDEARREGRIKRGGRLERVSLEQVEPSVPRPATDFIALDEALEHLAGIDPDKARVVELRFFGGLTEQDAAEVLGVSVRTVARHWRLARAWLTREMSR